MAEDMSNLAKNLVEKFGGGKVSFENVIKLLSSPAGKKVLSELVADGGKNLKSAAEKVRSGDVSGVNEIMDSISATEGGKELLKEITDEISK